MITDTGIVTIHDLENNGAKLTCHKVDAQEFLAHPSGRWSASPNEKKTSVRDAKSEKIDDDSGEAMKLKAMANKVLKAMAKGYRLLPK